ncbi:hypothetical protein EZV62_014302 [Acer yangbiense]|uniref:Folate transporter 1, chloroplastic n=1 Tax=Acer yangbiense TaxID=1000413 RepID=A0A5C7HSF0_9ROSI|nr:hypothetical protein EZV62_014302 [Acer yangbiense]
MSESPSQQSGRRWQWENATAGAVAGFATVAATHPLDVVRTRFQVNDGRVSNLPTYKNTAHAILTIARLEGLRGLYAGFFPAVIGSTVSWGLYFFFYGRAKQRYSKNGEEKLSPGLHLASAAEAGALVSHGAIQFTAYEELRKVIVRFKQRKQNTDGADNLLASLEKLGELNIEHFDLLLEFFIHIQTFINSVDYAILGGSSKVAAILMTYPFQVIRARLQQRPNDGIPRYMDSWHVVRETARFEGLRGFYKGITANLLKNAPAASITFIVYENVLKFLHGKNN